MEELNVEQASNTQQVDNIGIKPATPRKTAQDWFRDMRMSADVNKTTVGVETDRVTPELLLATSKKLLGISRREQEDDPKDSMQFQRVYGPAEYFSEHILRDSGKLGRNLLWKATNRGNLDFMSSGALENHVSGVFYDSKLAQMVDGSCPMELMDSAMKVSRIGEGGVADVDSAPVEMRLVQPSFYGFIDPVRCYAEGTELLTRDGWCKVELLKDDMELACLIEGKLEYHRPVSLHTYEAAARPSVRHDGPFSFLVTENHRMYVKLEGHEEFEIVPARELCSLPDAQVKIRTGLDSQETGTLVISELRRESGVHAYFCPTVPGGLVYCRYNGGNGFWCGNSPECTSASHLVFTSTGWKPIADVTVDDLVACLVDGRLTYEHPERVLSYDYEGELYCFRNKSIAYELTGNHRVWCKPLSCKGKAEKSGGTQKAHSTAYSFELAENMHNRPRLFMRGGHGALKHGVVTRKHIQGENEAYSFDMLDWCDFLGWYISEGCLLYTDRVKKTVFISQNRRKNPENSMRIGELLDRMGIGYEASSRGYSIQSEALYAELQVLGYCYEKSIPAEVFFASKEAQLRFIDSILSGCGRKSRTGLPVLCTTNNRLAADYERLLFNLGYAVSVKFEKEDKESRYYGCYAIRILQHTDARLFKNGHKQAGRNAERTDYYYRKPYKDRVYCLTVPGGLFYTKIDGYQGYWTGNSLRVGLDAYLSKGVMKGSDGRLYRKMVNAHTGKEELVDSVTAAKSVVTTPEMMQADTKSIYALGGKTGVRIVDKKDVDYYMPRSDEMFSTASNMVPMLNGVKEMRLQMGCLHPATPLLVVDASKQVRVVKAKDIGAAEISVPGSDTEGKSTLYKVKNTVAKFTDRKKGFKKIVLLSGRSLITSCDHRWSVIRDGEACLVEASKLHKGDMVTRSLFSELPARKTFILGAFVNADIAYLLGCAVRSLHAVDRNKLRIAYSKDREQTIRQAVEKLGIEPQFYAVQGMTCLAVTDQALSKWLIDNIGTTADTRRIPTEILSAGCAQASAFLDAYTCDSTKIGVDHEEDYWILGIENVLVRESLAVLWSRVGTDTYFRDSVGAGGHIDLALKLVEMSADRGDVAIDVIKTVVNTPATPIMIDIDVDDNLFACANGVITHNSKYALQAIPLEQREPQLVRTLDEASGKDMAQITGKYLGAQFAKKPGHVAAVRQDRIDVVYDDGTKGAIPLYKNFPMNAKGYIDNTPVVKAGQSFAAGDVLASSNYTDKQGNAAIGKPLRTAWISWKGGTYEDGLVISESCAKKMASTTMYPTAVDLDKTVSLGKKNYQVWKPSEFSKAQLEQLDNDGIVKPGTVLQPGDPMILAVQTSEPSPGTLGKRILTDLSEKWEHDHPGIVTDVVKSRKGVKVFTTVTAPVEVGDKMSGCFDDKTEVFTDRGFVLFKDLLPADRIAALTPDGIAKFELPKAYQTDHYTGCMIEYKSDTIDFKVTPNHNIAYTFDATGPLEKQTAAWLYKQQFTMRVAADFQDKSKHVEADAINNAATISTTDRELADKLQLCYLLAGKSCRIECAQSDAGSVYNVVVSDARFAYTSRSAEEWSIDDSYDGMIYCVTSSTGIILTRRNGIASWNGQSYGNKGVVSLILPDDEMPQDKDGNAMDLLLSPLGLISRCNPSQLHETLLGKVAKKLGKPEIMPAFNNGDLFDYVSSRMKQAKVTPTDDLVDPTTGRTLPGILNGYSYIYKLKHMSESKMAGRGTDTYTSEGLPAGGGYSGSKRYGSLEQSAMVGHEAFKSILDAKLIRGQSNSDFWRSIRTGEIPTVPGEPLVHRKFFAHLQGAGVNIRRTGKGVSCFALTNSDINELAGTRELKSRNTYEAKNFRPIDGGLFGQDVFGMNGDKWGYIQLDEPMPNPVMEDPLSKLLRMSENDFVAVAAGEKEVNGMKSSADIKARLNSLNLDKEAEEAKREFKDSTKSKKDAALKRYVAIERMRRMGVNPAEYMLDKIPVLPPEFRPVSSHGGLTMVADSNYLYAQLMDARDDMREARNLPEEYQNKARASLYRKWKELTGLYEPENPKLQNKNVKGLLAWAIGGGSPKYSGFQRKILGATVDTVGRGAIVSNSRLKLNQVGIPEKMAFDIFSPFVERELVKRGYTAVDALKLTKNHDPQAKQILTGVMETHPVQLNRAPTLHKLGILGLQPVLVPGHALHINPSICPVLGADFDGDQQIGRVNICISTRKLFSLETYEKIHEDSLTNFEYMLYYLVNRKDGLSEKTKRGIDMAYQNLKTQLKAIQNNNDRQIILNMDLADIPHGQLIKKNAGLKGSSDFYEALPGIKVQAYDENTGKLVWVDLEGWSEHRNCEVEIVHLANGVDIITDNDPRAVYGIAADATSLKPARFTPDQAKEHKVLVPCRKPGTVVEGASDINYIREDNLGLSADKQEVEGVRYHKLDFEFGQMLGLLVGDGWWDKVDREHLELFGGPRAVNLSDNEGYNASYLEPALNKALGEFVFEYKKEYKKDEYAGRYGDTVRYTYEAASISPFCDMLTALLGGERTATGTGSGSKHLPQWYADSPYEFRRGLLCGLIATDGSVSISRGKGKPQLMVGFCSTSLRLCRELRSLCITLGVRSSITFSKTTVRGNSAWQVTLSTFDLKKLNLLKGMAHARKEKIFLETEVSMDAEHSHGDWRPFPRCVYDVIHKWLKCPSIKASLRNSGNTEELERRQTASTLYMTMQHSVADGVVTEGFVERLNSWALYRAEEMRAAYELISTSVSKLENDVHLPLDEQWKLEMWKALHILKDLVPDGAYNTAKIMVTRRSKLGAGCKSLLEALLPYKNCTVTGLVDDPLFQEWVRLCTTGDCVWVPIESIEKTGKVETGYDLSVPGYETFISEDGVILSNTVNIHVPVSDQARQETRDRMFPEKNLIAMKDRKIAFKPEKEYMQGLYVATRVKANERPRIFDSLEDARKAQRDGMLDVDDPIIIRGN